MHFVVVVCLFVVVVVFFFLPFPERKKMATHIEITYLISTMFGSPSACQILQLLQKYYYHFNWSTLGALFIQVIVYPYLDFRFCYLNKLKLISIRVIELFESIFLKKNNVFLFFFHKHLLKIHYVSLTKAR